MVEEFANLCTIPLQKLSVSPDTSYHLLTSFVNAGALSNTWVALEHIDSLELSVLAMLCKEIQLVQQKVIIADLQKASHVPDKVFLALNQTNDRPDDEAVRRSAFGLFCSLQPFAYEPKKDNILLSCFRCTSLALPDFEMIIRNSLYTYGFKSLYILTKKILLFKDSILEKVNKPSEVFITDTEASSQDKNNKLFMFRIYEIFSLIEKIKNAKEAMKDIFEKVQAKINRRLKAQNKLKVEKSKDSTESEEAELTDEDFANTMRYNSEEDIDPVEKAVVAFVLAQYSIERYI